MWLNQEFHEKKVYYRILYTKHNVKNVCRGEGGGGGGGGGGG